MHDSSRNLRRKLTTLAISIGVASLAIGVSVALASLTFNGTSITGDSNSAIDATGTISIGATQATGVTIGRSGITANFPGRVTITGTTTTLQNLIVSGACTGCGGAASQWTTSGTSIYYDGGNVGIGASTPSAPLVVTNASNTYAPMVVFQKGAGSDSSLDLKESDYTGDLLRVYGENDAYAAPSFYIDNGVNLFLITSLSVSGHHSGGNINPPSSDPLMIGCWGDVGDCIQSRPNTSADYAYSEVNAAETEHVMAIDNNGSYLLGAGARGAYDLGLSRIATSVLEINNGTLGQNTSTRLIVGNLSIGTSTAPSGAVAAFNGNVGIGTTAPSTTLQVAGASSTIRIGASALPGCLEMGNSDGSAGINYVTILNGVISATTTKPSMCQ